MLLSQHYQFNNTANARFCIFLGQTKLKTLQADHSLRIKLQAPFVNGNPNLASYQGLWRRYSVMKVKVKVTL
jgi:hypothetical protein